MSLHAASSASSSSGRRPKLDGPRLSASPRLSRPASRLLAALAAPGAAAVPDPTGGEGVIVHAARSGVSLGRGVHSVAAARELADRDLTERAGDPGRGRFTISDSGRAHLRRLEAGLADAPFATQHRDLTQAERAGEHGPERVVVNTQESPLEWLRRRRGRDGEPLIDAAAFEAGERLRRDLTVAGMLPSVTARWDGAVATGTGAPRDPASAADAVVAARQRVRRTLDAVGGDFANLLLDLCGFLKGLELIERERGWPPRSGKVVVRLALRQLASHYGLGAEARGPAASRGLRSWQAEGRDVTPPWRDHYPQAVGDRRG